MFKGSYIIYGFVIIVIITRRKRKMIISGIFQSRTSKDIIILLDMNSTPHSNFFSHFLGSIELATNTNITYSVYSSVRFSIF
jgi:hypothetical protein